MTSFLSAEGGPISIKFRRLVQNDMSTAVIWSKSKPDVEFQYGGRLGEFNGISSQSHVSHCMVLPLIHCHDSRATCHIAGCKNSIRHIEDRFSLILFFYLFKCSLGFDERRLSIHLFIKSLLATTRAPYALFLFVCLSVCRQQKNAIFSKSKQFRAMVSIDDL